MVVNNAVGTCYEDAWRYLIKEEEGELIHGTVESLGRRIGHAWVELPTGFVWEPESRQFIKKADFQAIAKPQEEARYSVTEAAIMLTRVGKHGPWTGEERKRILKRGNPEDKRLLKVAIEREPLRVAKQLGYEIHRLSPKDIIDKEDYARGYRYRLLKADPAQPYPQSVMARSEGEVATFLKRQIEGNPPRVRFDRASIDSAIAAAKRLKSEKDLYIFATHLGYTIDSRPPPGMQRYVVVYPDGSTETVKPQIGGNPMKEVITKEEAIGMLERLSMTPEEAARSLVTDEAERREIMRTVQERVKREQNKWAPMDPREGPPLPRIFAGLRWPWRKQ